MRDGYKLRLPRTRGDRPLRCRAQVSVSAKVKMGEISKFELAYP